MAESVRLRTGLLESLRTAGIGRVATDRAEDTDVRRCDDGVGDIGVVMELEGGVGIVALVTVGGDADT